MSQPLTELTAHTLYQRYSLLGSGGMASVYLGRLIGAHGFQRIVAMKCLQESLLQDERMLAMLLDEARTTSRLRHPYIVDTLDVTEHDGALYLVMEFVLGETLASLLQGAARQKRAVPPSIASSMILQVLRALQAAHEAVDFHGNSLQLVHRDVTPHNVLVGVDGIARLLDFGVAKATGREQLTNHGEVKGKLAYMSPEYLAGRPSDLRTDVFGAGVMAWEVFCRKRLFAGPDANATIQNVLKADVPKASSFNPSLPPELDVVLARALTRDPSNRFASALDFAYALEALVPPANPEDVGAFVKQTANEAIAERMELIRTLEQMPLPSKSGQPRSAPKNTLVDEEETAELRNAAQRGRPPTALSIEDLGHETTPATIRVSPEQALAFAEQHRQRHKGEAAPPAKAPTEPPRRSSRTLRSPLDLAIALVLGILIAVLASAWLRPTPPPVPPEILQFLDAGGQFQQP